MSLSGMFEIPPPSGEVKLVMPANAGIQVRFRFKFQNRLDTLNFFFGCRRDILTIRG